MTDGMPETGTTPVTDSTSPAGTSAAPGPDAPGAAEVPAVPYGTPGAPRVAVRGEAHLEADPELARIEITVTARGTVRQDVVADLTRRNAGVLGLVRGHGDAVERLETAAFSVRPELRQGRGERVRAYHGYARTRVEFADFTALGELVGGLVGQELVQVTGPSWSLRRDSPRYREARAQAVRDAVQRAREYAAALGTTLAALVELADPGAEQAVAYGMPAAPGGPGFRPRGAAGGAESAVPDLEPQRQFCHAQVNARFLMNPPAL